MERHKFIAIDSFAFFTHSPPFSPKLHLNNKFTIIKCLYGAINNKIYFESNVENSDDLSISAMAFLLFAQPLVLNLSLWLNQKPQITHIKKLNIQGRFAVQDRVKSLVFALLVSKFNRYFIFAAVAEKIPPNMTRYPFLYLHLKRTIDAAIY